MAKFTYELREVISTFGRDEVKRWFSDYELSDYLTPEEITVIEERGTWNKDQLAERIIDHYYTREIGTDAIGQFMLFAKDKMREVMDTYAPLIYSSALKFDPLNSQNYTETYTGKSDNTSNTNTNSSDSGLVVNSDTPQGQISKGEILQGKYASSAGANEGESQTSGNSTSNGNEQWTRKMSGNSGVAAQELVKQYRDYIRALNTEIVYELEPLFMGIY